MGSRSGWKMTCASRGTTSTVARDGEQAVRLGTAEPFDLVVLDLMLPKKDGYQVLPRTAPRRHDDADHHADGARAGRREGARARTRRRRLHHQAVQPDGAARAQSRPCLRRAGRQRTDGLPVRRHRGGLRRCEVRRGGQLVDAVEPSSSSCCGVHRGARRRAQSRSVSSTPSGGATSTSPTGPWTTTSSACAGRSRPIPAEPKLHHQRARHGVSLRWMKSDRHRTRAAFRADRPAATVFQVLPGCPSRAGGRI